MSAPSASRERPPLSADAQKHVASMCATNKLLDVLVEPGAVRPVGPVVPQKTLWAVFLGFAVQWGEGPQRRAQSAYTKLGQGITSPMSKHCFRRTSSNFLNAIRVHEWYGSEHGPPRTFLLALRQRCALVVVRVVSGCLDLQLLLAPNFPRCLASSSDRQQAPYIREPIRGTHDLGIDLK